MLKAVIFDMDGTLGDTLPLCVESFRMCVKKITGGCPSEQEVLSHFGISDRGVLGALLSLSPDSPDLPISTLVQIYEELHPTLAPKPFDGAVELLSDLKAQGIKIGLLTGKEVYTAAPTIKQFGMEGLFDLILLGKPTHNCKAEELLEALQLWQLSPEEIIYVGDAPSDIALCHQAGVRIINAAWGSTAQTDEAACLALEPEYRLSNFSDLKPLIMSLKS